jgi:tetratricopeptide (TPR) repeat protein
MPQVDKVRKSHHKQFAFAAIAVIVILLVGVAGSYLYWRLVPSAATSVKRAQALDGAGNYSQAMTTLNSAYSRAIFKSDKTSILVWLAATKYDMGDYNASLTYYEQLNQMQPNNADNIEMLAAVAYQVGDNSVALSADEQELPFLESAKPKAPTSAADILAVQQQIAELKR